MSTVEKRKSSNDFFKGIKPTYRELVFSIGILAILIYAMSVRDSLAIGEISCLLAAYAGVDSKHRGKSNSNDQNEE